MFTAPTAPSLQIDGAGDAAHQPVRVRILAAEDGVDLDDVLLEIEGLQVMGDGHQVGFRRQLVGRVAPVGIHEGSELAGFDELLHPVLDVAEVAGRKRPGRDALAPAPRWPWGRPRAETTSTQSRACRW